MELNSNHIFLDFETRSKAKLTGKDSVGAWRYSIDATTSVICLSYAFGMGDPELWVYGQPQPPTLREAILDGCCIHGWNAMSFERAIFENQMKTKHDWKTPKLEQYYDTMSDALTLALPASLDECGESLDIVNKKDKRGKQLIQRLCTPISSGRLQGTFRTFEDNRSDFVDLFLYCKQDVRAEREIYLKLPYHVDSGKEREIQLLVARMNERGIPVDTFMVEKIAEALDFESDYIADRFEDITGIDAPTKREQFKRWLMSKGVILPNMQEATISGAISDIRMSDKVMSALSLYVSANKTSTAKYFKLRDMVCPDNTVKNNHIFNKANTGRLAGAGFQPQNLPSDSLDNPDPWIELFVDKELDFFRLWSSVHEVASQLVRAVIKAPEGMKLIAGDLKGVEARGGSWTACEWDMLNNFRQGLDQYRVSASNMYSKLYEEISKEERQAGKVAVLSGQFGGGYKALLRMALKYGIIFSDSQAKEIVRDFRRGRPALPASWKAFERAAHRAMEYPGGLFYVDRTKRFSFRREGEYLFLFLPSGRRLSFPFPRMEEVKSFGSWKTELTAMWVDSSPGGNHKWTRRSLRGPNLYQSGVQASCRDFLTDGHIAAEEENYLQILSVHDEAVSLVPDDMRYSPEQYGKILTRLPEWALDFPLEADCWEGYRYRK